MLSSDGRIHCMPKTLVLGSECLDSFSFLNCVAHFRVNSNFTVFTENGIFIFLQMKLNKN